MNRLTIRLKIWRAIARFSKIEWESKKHSNIQKRSGGNISFRIVTRRLELPIRTGQASAYPEFSDLMPSGVEVHVSDPVRLEEYFRSALNYPIKLSAFEIEFNDLEGTISAGNRKSTLPPDLNEHRFCRAMFKKLPHVAVDWSLIFQDMNGLDPIVTDSSNEELKKWARAVRDTMYAVNDRIKKDFNTEDGLFSWNKLSATRNF
jgi:hypothetical protein